MHEPASVPPPEPAPAGATVRSQMVRELSTAFGLGLVGVGVLLARVWANPARRLVGDWQDVDVLSSHWTFDWVARRVAGLGGVLHTNAVFAPVGETPLASAGGAAPVFGAPFLVLLGWPLGLNVYLALVCAANVAAGALLARAAGASRRSALIGGLALGFSPYLLTELSAGRFTQVPFWEGASALAVWLRLLGAPSRRRALLFAGFFGLATLEYAWYGLFVGMAAAVLAGAALLADRSRRSDAVLRLNVLLATLGAMIASAPGLYVILDRVAPAAEPKVPQPLALEYSLPPLWPFGTEGGPLVPAAVSGVVAVLALAGLLLRRRDRDAWVGWGLAAIGLLGWVLSMGPRMLTAGGPIVDSHFPFFVVYSLLLPAFVQPYQHALLVSVALAVLAARGASALAHRLSPRAELVLVALVAVFAPVELWSRGVALQPKVSHLAAEPPWLTQLRDLPEGAILELPLAPELRVSQEHLLLQMLHNHPVVDGRSQWLDGQRPGAWDAWVAESGFLKELERFERGREVPGDATRANYFRYPVEDVARVTGQGVRWVLVWDPLYGEPIKGLARAERALFAQLCGAPALEAKGVTVYDLQALRGTGDMLAPVWRMPERVRTGDGIRRMAGGMPPGVLFERAE